MAGYGTIPTDKNATVAVVDPGVYLGDASASRLSNTDIGVIAGVSVFFGVLVIAIFAWQLRNIRDRKRLASVASSGSGGRGGPSSPGHGRFEKARGGGGADDDGFHANKDDVELKEFDSVAPAAIRSPRVPEHHPAGSYRIPVKDTLPPLPLPPPPPRPSAAGRSQNRFSAGSKGAAHESHYTVTTLLKALREGKTKDAGAPEPHANMV